jgi:hypothetical protein
MSKSKLFGFLPFCIGFKADPPYILLLQNAFKLGPYFLPIEEDGP